MHIPLNRHPRSAGGRRAPPPAPPPAAAAGVAARSPARAPPAPPDIQHTWNVHQKHIPGGALAHTEICPANVTCSCPGAWMVYGWITVACASCLNRPPARLRPLRCNPSAAAPPLPRAGLSRGVPRIGQCSDGAALTTARSSRGDGAHVGAQDEFLRNLLEARGLGVELGSLDELQEQVGQPLAQPGERAL